MNKIYLTPLVAVGIIILIFGAYTFIQTDLPKPTPTPTITNTPTPQPTQQATQTPTITLLPTLSPTPTETPTPSTSPTSTPPNLTPTPMPSITPSPTPAPATAKATNWAGYIVATDIFSPQQNVTGVSASWTVPSVAPSTNDTFSSAWIGIGGEFEKSLIQCGTQHDYYKGQTVYSAWYELLPQNAIKINSFRITPGDQMQATIQLLNSTSNQWKINITDITTGRSFQNIFTYTSNQTSAEWIVERPTVNGAITQLANFGNATFTQCQASIDNTWGNINNYSKAEITMYSSINLNENSTKLAEISSLGTDGSSFTVNYLASS